MVEASRVYLVDGDLGERRSLSHLLANAGYEVWTFDSARAFLELASIIATGCVLATVEAPRADGYPPAMVLDARRPDLPVILMSATHGDVALAVQAIKAGAADFLETSCSDAQVLAAVDRALRSLSLDDAQDRVLASTAARIAEMSDHERDVLRGLLAGGTNETIGRRLGISPRTVEVHRAHMMERLGAHSLSEAVRLAVAAGLQAAAA